MIKKQYSICVSILKCQNVCELTTNLIRIQDTYKDNVSKKYVQELLKLCIHFDVMDAKFVSSSGVDIENIKTSKDFGMYADTHLMVKEPIEDGYIAKAIEYGSDDITIHYEIDKFESILDYLNDLKAKLAKEGRVLNIGVSIKPDTDVSKLLNYKDKFSKILIMSVEPGYGGQAYIEDTIYKIREAKKLFTDKSIQVDGGINDTNFIQNLEAGIDSFVIGSYITDYENLNDLYNKITKLNILNDIWTNEKSRNIEFDKKLLQVVPGGYGEKDKLIGINVPSVRTIANKWSKAINLDILNNFISSPYHECRQFAIFCLANTVISKMYSIDEIYEYYKKNIEYINNWDLTDDSAPNILGRYLFECLERNIKINIEISKYLDHDNLWVKRIGIVSQLFLVRKNILDLPLDVCKKMLYVKENLLQKAVGWVLREIYKKDNEIIIQFLKHNNSKKKIPSIILSYACEKMTKDQKDYIKNN
ncbi:MAG: DNA alkylation repair protein [Clostridia bacterium]|nr:DNA alkylation repair protein [Clostridia bacterium]